MTQTELKEYRRLKNYLFQDNKRAFKAKYNAKMMLRRFDDLGKKYILYLKDKNT